jgi:L-cystine uptake protein TcyP (sodium:dicarboxylate symporter family)
MKEQNFRNHSRMVPLYHYVLLLLILLAIIGSIVKLYRSYQTGLTGLLVPGILLLLSIALLITAAFARTFALKAQDRAIRAEESLRYFVLTGKLHDHRLRIGQIIALRFSTDDEFVQLTQRAVSEKMAPKQIKEAISKWKADDYRV